MTQELTQADCGVLFDQKAFDRGTSPLLLEVWTFLIPKSSEDFCVRFNNHTIFIFSDYSTTSLFFFQWTPTFDSNLSYTSIVRAACYLTGAPLSRYLLCL